MTTLRDSGLTAAQRAALEFLYPDVALTVPDIARRYQASRQHVQVTINGLLDAGLVVSRWQLCPLCPGRVPSAMALLFS